MKAWLKETTKKIREGKKAKKEYQRNKGGVYPYGLGAMIYEYRHNHIAYSLARGKTIEQIESKHRVDENGNKRNPPSMSQVNSTLLTLLIKDEVPA